MATGLMLYQPFLTCAQSSLLLFPTVQTGQNKTTSVKWSHQPTRAVGLDDNLIKLKLLLHYMFTDRLSGFRFDLWTYLTQVCNLGIDRLLKTGVLTLSFTTRQSSLDNLDKLWASLLPSVCLIVALDCVAVLSHYSQISAITWWVHYYHN